jgi:hypothetical protein
MRLLRAIAALKLIRLGLRLRRLSDQAFRAADRIGIGP